MYLWIEKRPALKFVSIIGIAFFVYYFLPNDMPEAAQRVSFIFIIAAFFWAFEIIPLYATSLLVIILEIFLLCRPGGVLNMGPGDYEIFLIPFGSPVIILFFGGFILAAALHKYELDKFIATHLLKLFGSKPFSVLLGLILVTAMLSMWMSNTATTAMMIAMVLPLLKQMNPNDKFRTALVLAIPFSADIGGMGTPIGSPPNAIAIGILANNGIIINFISWMKMAIPLVIILLSFTAFVLYTIFPPTDKYLNFEISFQQIKNSKAKYVLIIAIFTILLWLTSGIHKIPSAVIALLAVGLFSVSGLLEREDFQTINWDILILMWGGLALGKGMEISGLTDWLIQLPMFQQKGIVLISIFCVLAVLLSLFISNTATANLLIPIVMAIPDENSVLLATTVALSCSLAMALPISTPPNAIAFSTNMLKSKDMLKAGSIISLISLIIILLGFKLVITSAFGLH